MFKSSIRLLRNKYTRNFLSILLISFFLVDFVSFGSLSPTPPQEYGNEDLQKEILVILEESIDYLEDNGFGNTLDTFIDAVLSSGKLVFLYFYAEWCYFCKQEKPILDELEAIYSDNLIFIQLDEAKNPEAMDEFGVQGDDGGEGLDETLQRGC